MWNATLRILLFAGLTMAGVRVMQSVDGNARLQEARQYLTGDHKETEKARKLLLEIVQVGNADSVYEHRRSPHWLKMKCEATQELVVGGFTDPQGTRQGLGALLLGYFEGDDFVFAGKVGTGFDVKQLVALRTRLDELEVAITPF